MHMNPLEIRRLNSGFDHISVNGTKSESIGIVKFQNETTGEKLCSAILLPTDTEIALGFETNSAGYPIFFPDGEVSVEIGFLINKGEKILYANITCSSLCGKTQRQLHGLGSY